ncbi:hypothetical protein EMPS_11506 [Entomortierella parvispora]|uniref:Uncharacterized protein n=1 Tax=Entomortierella parvispora TaxID=205924 RepID=A0A9P3M2I5_9FUNG|nr:hypothetical protein EMPS_11506 [Entomortierella parvispora]
MLFAKTLIALISATAVLAQSPANAVASGAFFVGEDTTESSVTARSMFEKPENHITAVSSVLAFAAKSVNFQPASKPAKSLVTTLDAFVERVSTFPGFITSNWVDTSIKLNGSFTQLEKMIREADDHITHLPLIARNIRDLVPGYIQDKSLKKWILSLVVLDNPEDSGNPKFKLVRVVLDLSTDKDHTVFIPEQTAKLVIVDFHANGASLIANAATLSTMIPTIVSPRDAVDLFTSPKVIEDTTADLWAFLREKSFSLEAYDWQVVLNWKK